jgi:outer membrane lipoprotein-sorting protein
MARLLALLIGLVAGTCWVSGFASGGNPVSAAANPTRDDAAAIARVEDHLNNIETMVSRFIQISSNGTYAEGQMYVDRPGHLRFEYDAPNTTLLIANGQTLLYYDRELKEATFIPLWETPLWFLLREKVSLSSNLDVVDVDRGKGTLSLTVQEADTPDRGRVTLTFSDQPLVLKRWEVLDSQGVTTQVALVNPRFGVEVDPQLFSRKGLEYGSQRRPIH